MGLMSRIHGKFAIPARIIFGSDPLSRRSDFLVVLWVGLQVYVRLLIVILNRHAVSAAEGIA